MSGYFTFNRGHVDVRALPDGENWQLLREVQYVTGWGLVITIPATFVTDFASVPRILWRIAPPATGKHIRAALVHDWLYRTPGVNVTRAQADGIFLAIMEMDGVAWATRQALYMGVRVGGASSFKTRSNPWAA